MTKQETKAQEAKGQEAKAKESKDETTSPDSIAEPIRKPTTITAKVKGDVERVVAPIGDPNWEPAGLEPTDKEKAVFKRYLERLKKKEESK